MTTFLSQSDLAKNGLKLYLSNEFGYPQDAASVRWSIISMATGNLVSGKSLQAIKSDTGQYYAPWFSDVKAGSYEIVWEIKDDWDSDIRSVANPFFVIEPSSYTHGLSLSNDSLPVTGGLTFLIGSNLGPNDLFVTLRDENGMLQDAYSVMWHIQNSRGCAITSRVFAAPYSVGVYYAPWVVTVGTGNFKIVWEYQQYQDSPLQSTSQSFSVLGTASPFMVLTERGCPPVVIAGYNNLCRVDARILSGANTVWGYNPIYSACNDPILPTEPLSYSCCNNITTVSSCGGGSICPSLPVSPSVVPTCCGSGPTYEISRQVHIPSQVLPSGGAFTNQNPFPIPSGARKFTFYITYTRGADHGYSIFRIMWGNGVEEYPETILDMNLTSENPYTSGQNLTVQNLYSPVPLDGNPINFVLCIAVPGGATTVRLLAAEKGVQGSPGTIGITLTAST